ncbi:Sodium/potassium/calcium exchanger 4, partial [Operophtera brumata]
NCTPAAILEFPPDGFTRFQRQHGYIVLHCLLAIYCFLLLGTVCEQYFVPAIEMICERLNMEADIAGATFMAAASSSPELFINCVGTFVTEGDLGVGAVVGSAVFNVLAAIEIDWWSVTRDCMMYAVAVVALILTLLDDKVYWHEALVLVLMYTFYILEKLPVIDPSLRVSRSALPNDPEQGMELSKRHDSTSSAALVGDVDQQPAALAHHSGLPPPPAPLSAHLPHVRRLDRRGHGTMGISNSIGSNTFDILLCLGLPWLIKGLFYPSSPGQHWVTINSSGLSYSAISLLSTLFTLYGCLALNKFQLDWKIGVTCTLVYIGYLTLAALIELNVFFVVNLPVCPH